MPKPYGIFERVHVFNPRVEIDSAWLPAKERAANVEGSSFHSEWDEKTLKQILYARRIELKN